MNKEVWKAIEALIVFIIGDVVAYPVTSYLNIIFPNPEANLLANPTALFILIYVFPGAIADFIWFVFIKKLKKK